MCQASKPTTKSSVISLLLALWLIWQDWLILQVIYVWRNDSHIFMLDIFNK